MGGTFYVSDKWWLHIEYIGNILLSQIFLNSKIPDEINNVLLYFLHLLKANNTSEIGEFLEKQLHIYVWILIVLLYLFYILLAARFEKLESKKNDKIFQNFKQDRGGLFALLLW